MPNNSPNNLALVNSLHYILHFYFGNVKREIISALSGVSEEEFGIDDVFTVAQETNLFASKEQLDISNLESFLLPLILLDKNGEVAVLKSISTQGAVLYVDEENPNVEIKKSALKKYSEVIFFFRNERDRVLSARSKTLSWFFEPIKATWRAYVEVGVLSLFINIFALAVPLFTMNVYDRVIPNFATETLIVLVSGVLIIFAFELALKSVRVYILENSGKKIAALFEEKLLNRMMNVRTQYDHLLSGTKANLFKELQQVKEFFTSKTLVQILDLPFFFIALFVIYWISPTIAMIPFIAGLIMVSFNLIMQYPLASLAHEQFKEAQSKNGYLIETIHGRESLKLINAQSQRLFKWRRLVAFYEHLSQRIATLNHFTTNTTYIIIQAITLMVVFVGVYEVHNKNLSIGGLIAVTILSSRAMVPIVNLSGVLLQFKKIKEALTSLNDYWHLPQERSEKSEIGIGDLKGDIEFSGVSYYYKNATYPSLDNINLKIKAGERVGIIGQTGAGKSTILRLLSALDLPSSGSLYLDGHESSTIHPVEIRESIGVMPQDPYLFAGSIKDNISLSRSVSKEELVKLLELTGLDSLIKKSAQGDSLDVGENGEYLSMGQKNLVALARSLVHEPKILILDEPTTGLDVGLEQNVIARLKGVVEDKTLIVITHRFAALELVDRVIVIENGKIVADGEKNKILAMLQGGK